MYRLCTSDKLKNGVLYERSFKQDNEEITFEAVCKNVDVGRRLGSHVNVMKVFVSKQPFYDVLDSTLSHDSFKPKQPAPSTPCDRGEFVNSSVVLSITALTTSCRTSAVSAD